MTLGMRRRREKVFILTHLASTVKKYLGSEIGGGGASLLRMHVHIIFT